MVRYAKTAVIQGATSVYVPRSSLPTDEQCAALFEAMEGLGHRRWAIAMRLCHRTGLRWGELSSPSKPTTGGKVAAARQFRCRRPFASSCRASRPKAPRRLPGTERGFGRRFEVAPGAHNGRVRSRGNASVLPELRAHDGRSLDRCPVKAIRHTYVRVVPSSWRDGFKYAWQLPDPEPEGPGLVWRETGANYWSGSSGYQPAARSCSRRRDSGWRTCDSRTRPASHPSPPSAGTPPSKKHRSR